MRTLLHRIDSFFFARVSATGFGVMRSVWGAGLLIYFIRQWPAVTRYYSGTGQLPLWLDYTLQRTDHRFSVFLTFSHPDAVFLIYLLFLISAACATVGFWPRLSTIVSTLLLFSFHERNSWHTTGGDIVLRSVGFLLCIAPGGVHAFSVARARKQWKHWSKTRTLLPPLTMPAWPQRLLLWQLLVIYLQSMWSKLLGNTWLDGTAVAIALHHTIFGRFPGAVADTVSIVAPFIGWGAIVWEAVWTLMLIPRGSRIAREFAKSGVPVDLIRRWLLASGLLVHGVFSVLLRLGSFMPAMPAILLGNLQGEDFVAIRKRCNRRWNGKISVFYDSDCGLCGRSMCMLLLLDWLHRLRPVDFCKAQERTLWAPDLPLPVLDRALHVRFPDGATLKGFSAFRSLAWHLPALWPLAPLLQLPGMTFVGDRVYARVAKKRKQCNHVSCA